MADIVLALTRKENEDYFKYIDNIKASSTYAAKIKYYDLMHNMDLGRLSNITEKDIKRREKYLKAMAILKVANIENFNEI